MAFRREAGVNRMPVRAPAILPGRVIQHIRRSLRAENASAAGLCWRTAGNNTELVLWHIHVRVSTR